jgi:hypothetical protein
MSKKKNQFFSESHSVDSKHNPTQNNIQCRLQNERGYYLLHSHHHQNWKHFDVTSMRTVFSYTLEANKWWYLLGYSRRARQGGTGFQISLAKYLKLSTMWRRLFFFSWKRRIEVQKRAKERKRVEWIYRTSIWGKKRAGGSGGKKISIACMRV